MYELYKITLDLQSGIHGRVEAGGLVMLAFESLTVTSDKFSGSDCVTSLNFEEGVRLVGQGI
jgi:hypothetical protein